MTCEHEYIEAYYYAKYRWLRRCIKCNELSESLDIDVAPDKRTWKITKEGIVKKDDT